MLGLDFNWWETLRLSSTLIRELTAGLTTTFFPPQPVQPQDTWRLADGTAVRMRVARKGDHELMQNLIRGLSLRSRFQRFFYPAQELLPQQLDTFTLADPRRAVTLLALIRENGADRAVGMAQYVAGDEAGTYEFAVVVADAWQRTGIASRLMHDLLCIAKSAGISRIQGDVLTENSGMRKLLLKMEFDIGRHPNDMHLFRAWKSLDTPQAKQEAPCAAAKLLAVSE